MAWCSVVPAAAQVLMATISRHHDVPRDGWWIGLGLVVGLAVTVLRRPNWFIHTLIHETCHLLVATVLLVPVHRLVVSDGRGGQVEHQATGPLRAALIALAPYTLPLLLAPLLVARALTAQGTARGILSAACALAYVTHLTGLFHNLRLNLRDATGDLAKVGRVLSLALIATVLQLVTAWTCSVLWSDTWYTWHGHAASQPAPGAAENRPVRPLSAPAPYPEPEPEPEPQPGPAAVMPPPAHAGEAPVLQPEQPLDPR